MPTVRYNTTTQAVSKYKAKKAQADGINFHSIKERDYYLRLKGMKDRGEIRYFLCQVPFLLPGPTKYLLDFMIVMLDGDIKYVDVKGVMTPMSKLKMKQVHDLYKIDIDIV